MCGFWSSLGKVICRSLLAVRNTLLEILIFNIVIITVILSAAKDLYTSRDVARLGVLRFAQDDNQKDSFGLGARS